MVSSPLLLLGLSCLVVLCAVEATPSSLDLEVMEPGVDSAGISTPALPPRPSMRSSLQPGQHPVSALKQELQQAAQPYTPGQPQAQANQPRAAAPKAPQRRLVPEAVRVSFPKLNLPERKFITEVQHVPIGTTMKRQ